MTKIPAMTVAAAFLGFCCAPFAVQAQSSPPIDTIQLITGGGKVRLETAQGASQSSCSTTSTDHAVAVAVAVGGHCSSFGTSADVPEALYVKIAEDKLMFREGGKSYVVRDAAVIDGARGLFAPVREMMSRQADLGQQMRDLGARERTSVPPYTPARVNVPDLNSDFQKVEADAKRLSVGGGTQSELSELQSELSELQSRISEVESEASAERAERDAEKSELNSQMSSMNAQMKDMNEQMNAWGRQGQDVAIEAVRQVKALLDRAVANGTAKPE